MRLIRPIGGLLALALTTSPLAAADINKRDLGGIQPVKLETLLANPQTLMFAEVKFRVTFAAVTDLFDFQRSNFRPERYAAIAVWDDRAKLWQPEARADVLTSIYLPKDRIASTRTALFNKYDQLEIAGIVKDVIEGVPQIEVTGIQVIREGAYTDASIYHVEQAVALSADGARDLADEHFAKALATDLPLAARTDIAVLRGRTLIDAGRFDVAAEVLTEAVQASGKDAAFPAVDRANLYALLAKAQIELAERSDGSRRQAAVDNANKALSYDPSNGEAYAVLGIGLAGLGRYDEARRNCDNAVRLRPADAEVRWYLGRILDQQGHGDEAIDALKKAIDLTPKDWRIHKAIAAAYHHRGLKGGPSSGQDLTTALREYDITLRLNPNDADVLVLSGGVIEDAAKAGGELQIGSTRTPATRELALARYEQATQANPKLVSAWRALGLLQAALGNAEGAKASAAKLTELGAVSEAAEVSTASSGSPAPAPAPVRAPAPPAEAPPAEAPAAPVEAPAPAAEDPSIPAAPAAEQVPAAPEAIPAAAPEAIPAAEPLPAAPAAP